MIRRERLADELIRNGADQNAAAEAHDDAERPLADLPLQRVGAAGDQRRRSEESPSERGEHSGGSIAFDLNGAVGAVPRAAAITGPGGGVELLWLTVSGETPSARHCETGRCGYLRSL